MKNIKDLNQYERIKVLAYSIAMLMAGCGMVSASYVQIAALAGLIIANAGLIVSVLIKE